MAHYRAKNHALSLLDSKFYIHQTSVPSSWIIIEVPTGQRMLAEPIIEHEVSMELIIALIKNLTKITLFGSV